MSKKRVLCVVGTRPEAIKMAPVILRLREESWADVRVLATAQHRELLDQILSYFDIVPDIDLDIMSPNQSLIQLTARLLTAVDEVLAAEMPDVVLVQGDTTTVMTVALACFYRRIPLGHIEAGLRTGDIWNPFPEEANRIIAGRFARWHFAPTIDTRENLLREGVPDGDIFVTGNTVVDALLMTAQTTHDFGISMEDSERLVLITSHRRENFGEPFSRICDALRRLAINNFDVQFLYPVHPNPNVRKAAYECLSNLRNFHLCDPLEYGQFVSAMKRAYVIITDSGGVQEEAPALGKPVLVLRDETERPEAVDQGVVKLVGTDVDRIVVEVQTLLDDESAYRTMARGVSPYGDGKASGRIANALKAHLAPCV